MIRIQLSGFILLSEPKHVFEESAGPVTPSLNRFSRENRRRRKSFLTRDQQLSLFGFDCFVRRLDCSG